MRNLRTEQEIIANWKGDPQEPVVSICCITYNHEPYIVDALEGFLIQETDFPFEILIHDDASTDKTAEIIREYETTYPNLIKPMYQTENQYSKGKKPNPEFNFPRTKGDYIALCEGDDYWIDTKKLSRQFERIQRYPQCNICFHPALKVNAIKGKCIDTLGNISNREVILPTKEVLKRGIAFIPTCSLFFKKTFLENNEVKKFLKEHGSSFFLKFLGSITNGCLYLPGIASCYRVNSVGSDSGKRNIDKDYAIDMCLKVNYAFDISNHLTKFYYNYEIKKIQRKRLLSLLLRRDIKLLELRKLIQDNKHLLYFFENTIYLRFFSSLKIKYKPIGKLKRIIRESIRKQ